MYIKSAAIYNFRSHKETALSFSPGLNVIIGESDTGKTALLSALYWCLFNRPLGSSFRSNWGGDTKTEVLFGDGHKIQRIKTNSKNYYKVPGVGRFDALGKGGIPKEIEDIVNLDPINVQFDTDANFLFTKTPAEVAKYINQIVDLEIIHRSLAAATSDKRRIERKIDFEKEELDKAVADVKKYNWVDEADHALTLLEQMQNEVRKASSDIKEISAIIKSIENKERKLRKVEKLLAAATEVNKLVALQKQIDKQKDRADSLNNTIKSIEGKYDQAQALAVKIKRMRKQLPKVCPFCNKPIGKEK